MNHTTLDTTVSSSGFCHHPRNLANISPDVRAVFIARNVANALTCPLIIVLNILVMVAVKTKPQLRTKSNIALVWLSTTDLVVGLVLQPLHIASSSSLLKGDIMFCTITDLAKGVTLTCLLASFHHLILMSAERYVAIKYPFAYQTKVTEVRIIMASAMTWAVVIIVAVIIRSSGNHLITAILFISETLLILLPVHFNVSVYKDVRRNEKQIAANHVSLEAKEKLLKNKKAFYTTVIVLVVILLCYVPAHICFVILLSFKERIPPDITFSSWYLITSLPVLNSLFNPLIYAVRISYFRVAFIQLLSKKTISQAEELERKIFRPRQIGVSGNVNAEQGNQTLNDEQKPTERAEPHSGCK